MPWNSTTKMMSLPIGLGDIAQAVGYASGDLGTLIRNGVINKWAKFKPVRRGGLDYSSQMNSGRTEWQSGSTWWKGDDGHCGLSIEESTDLGSFNTGFLYKLRTAALPWNYVRPQGGIGVQPYRAFDFFRYKGDAEAPVGAIAATDIWLDSNYAGQFDFDTNSPDGYELSLGDILLNNAAMTNYYLGVMLWKSNGTYYLLTSSSKFVAGGSISIPFTGAQSLVGTWQMVPFISSRQYSMGSAQQSGIYASLFGIGNTEVVLHAPGTVVDFVVFGEWNAAGTAISYELVITNHSSAQQSLSGVAVELRTTTGSQAPASGTLVTTVNIGSVTVPANGSVSRMGTITGLTKNSSLTYWVKGYATGYTNAEYMQVEESPDTPE